MPVAPGPVLHQEGPSGPQSLGRKRGWVGRGSPRVPAFWAHGAGTTGAAGPGGRRLLTRPRVRVFLAPPQPGRACAAQRPAGTGARARRRAATTTAAAPTASPGGTVRSVRPLPAGIGPDRAGWGRAGGGALRGGRGNPTPDSERALCFQGSRTPAPRGPVTTAAPAFTTSANTSVTVPQASPGGTAR